MWGTTLAPARKAVKRLKRTAELRDSEGDRVGDVGERALYGVPQLDSPPIGLSAGFKHSLRVILAQHPLRSLSDLSLRGTDLLGQLLREVVCQAPAQLFQPATRLPTRGQQQHRLSIVCQKDQGPCKKQAPWHQKGNEALCIASMQISVLKPLLCCYRLIDRVCPS